MPGRRRRCRRLTIAALALAAVLSSCSTAGPESELSGAPVTTTTVPVDPAIVALMDGAGMTPAARTVFVAASPALEDKATLATSCAGLGTTATTTATTPATTPATTTATGTAHTYGCVVRGKVHIRLFTAPELHDMIYVVAADAVLHVVYGQMRMAERQRLDLELELARADNAALEDRLKVYAASADDTPNEVHSVLGTEFGALSPALEIHFSHYFDRPLVLAAFRRTVGDREEAIRQLEAKVDEMKERLDNMSAEMEALRAAGDLRTFNTRVPTYNALVRQHNAAVDELKTLVEAHKQLISS